MLELLAFETHSAGKPLKLEFMTVDPLNDGLTFFNDSETPDCIKLSKMFHCVLPVV